MNRLRKQEGVHWVRIVGVGIMLAILVRVFFFSIYVVEGKSMMPTLQDGNLIVINKIGREMGKLHRFDVVVFHANQQEDYVKRIIGLPGDTIEYIHDRLYINGHLTKEPFLDAFKAQMNGRPLTDDFNLKQITGTERVPNGYVFVLGDNRTKSWDSRYFGFVDMTQIVGKVDLRYWPINEVSTAF